MQLKSSSDETRETDSQQGLCSTSNQASESEGVSQLKRQMQTKHSDGNGTAQQSRGDGAAWLENDLSQSKVPEEASNQRRLVKMATTSQKTPTARRKKRRQAGGDSQVLPRISRAGFDTNDMEVLEAAKVESSVGNQKSSSDASQLINKKSEDPRGPGPFFYFGGGNGLQLVSEYCLNKGWQRIQDSKRDDYKLKWCETKSSATYHAFREGEQLLYQIPNNKVLTSKIGLLISLREYERVMQKMIRARMLKMADFFPQTFRLDLKDDAETFFSTYEDGQTWICKPTGLNQGRGIYLLKNQEQVSTLQCHVQTMMEESMSRKFPAKCQQARIVQRYIPNPLLLEGKKFDIRSYLLIASAVPYFVFFRHGYVRLTCNPYDPKSDDLTGHLTNQRRMQQIMIHCFLSVKSKLDCRRGYFDLIGCDFLIDDEFKVWLLEMNCNPALHTNCEVLKEVIPAVVNETLDLALEIFNKSFKGQRIMPLNTQKKFVLLFNGESNEQAIKFNWPRSSSPVKEEKRTMQADSPNKPMKNVERPLRLLKVPQGNGLSVTSRPTMSRSPQRPTLAMSPVNMMGLHDGMPLHSSRLNARHNITSKSHDGLQNNNLPEVGRTKSKTEQTAPVAKLSFTGPQKFRVLGRKTPQLTRRSTPVTPVTTSVVVLSDQNRVLFSRASLHEVGGPVESKPLEDAQNNQQVLAEPVTE
ncbi:inactive polyglycylase TTLL10 isoform X2 [Hyperolius riggenbachi]|uniref:inactive polyglycylase TTLL10 isoform X2 n=1 Tax=Hyperolius riggenbachi TaxID=752182 RepID=UPI0035A2E100